ncbi:uncharacterized protein LOC124914071 [Impatiens glandulifera]|uniref:uncharacterized protein LOC124914071 n=1 Tax=Impatiens glandulifera TaxID=253017 RepID=UPI001FB13349|nr:uncharacterized protein LOC124914071 [Impatiens glandulifera]
MITLEHKETVASNCEASIRCLQVKEEEEEHPSDVFPELKDDVTTPGGSTLETENRINSEPVEPSSKEFNGKPTTTFMNGFSSWLPFHPEASNVVHCQYALQTPFYPFPAENHLHYAPYNIFPQNYPHDNWLQDFQYFVVIDFEATCDKAKNPHPQEIIEFPSVIVSSVTGQLEACFQTYVRPTCNQLLSDFCTDLTGIQQNQVDRGVTLTEALLRHDKWLEKKGIKNTNFAVVTWSNWDCRVMLESECRYKKIRKPPYFNRWINLKIPFREVFGGRSCNLKEAVQMAGLAWQGRAHCGLDDAKNTARLLAYLMRKGFKFSFTDSLLWEPPAADNHNHRPSTWKQQQQQPMDPFIFPPFQPPYHNRVKDMLHNNINNNPVIHVRPAIQTLHHHNHNHNNPYCHCGVKSSKGMVRKPGPKQGSCFFGCGNWTTTRGARCQYFEWASS